MADWDDIIKDRNTPASRPHPRSEAEAQQAIAELRREVAQQREINRTLAEGFDALRTRFDAHHDAAHACAGLIERVEVAESRIDVLSRRAFRKAEGEDGHDERHDDLVEAVAKLRRRIETMEQSAEERDALPLRVAELITGLAALEQSRREDDRRINEAGARLDTYSGSIEGAYKELSGAKDRLAALEGRVNELAQARELHNEALTQLRDDLLDFRNTTTGNVEGAFEDRARLQARIAELEDAFTAPSPAARDAVMDTLRSAGVELTTEVVEDSEGNKVAVFGTASVAAGAGAPSGLNAKATPAEPEVDGWGSSPHPAIAATGESRHLPALPWRAVGPDFRDDVRQHVANIVDARLSYGARKHGPVYTGSDPADDLEEELIDALVYLAILRQQREVLERRANEGD